MVVIAPVEPSICTVSRAFRTPAPLLSACKVTGLGTQIGDSVYAFVDPHIRGAVEHYGRPSRARLFGALGLAST